MNARIILHKDQLLYDIEALAYKYSEAAGLEPKSKNIVAADHNEAMDGRIISRMIDIRDARLRTMLQFCLTKTELEVVCDNPDERTELFYKLSLPDGFDGDILTAVKTFMHDYIVRGVLFDWYAKIGVQTIAVTEDEVNKLGEKVASLLRGKSWVKAPMQPFGPRKKIY